MVLNMLFTVVPRLVTEAIATSEIKATNNAYSTRSCPSSLLFSDSNFALRFEINLFIWSSFSIEVRLANDGSLDEIVKVRSSPLLDR